MIDHNYNYDKISAENSSLNYKYNQLTKAKCYYSVSLSQSFTGKI